MSDFLLLRRTTEGENTYVAYIIATNSMCARYTIGRQWER